MCWWDETGKKGEPEKSQHCHHNWPSGDTGTSQLLIQFYWNFLPHIYYVFISSSVFCPKAGPSLQVEKPRLQFCRRQVFHRKFRNQGCSFTRDLIGAVASRCFTHPTLSLASEQTLKDLKRSQGHRRGSEESDLANWALRTSPKFATEVRHQGFWPDQRSGNPNQPSPPVFI